MKKSHLHNIKNSGFKTPDGYFDAFDERLLKKLNVNKEMASISDSGFKVPDNYFETFDDKLQAHLKNENSSTKVIKLNPWRKVAYLSGVAASIALLLTFLLNSKGQLTINQIETASIENYLIDQNLNAYDIASFLNEEDLIVDNFISSSLTEESLENYLINNTSIEDLIIGK